MTGVFTRERRERVGPGIQKRHTEGRSLYKDRGREPSDVTSSQGIPGATRSYKKQGKSVPWSLGKEHDPADTIILDSGIHNCRTANVSPLKTPSLCYSVYGSPRKLIQHSYIAPI